MSLEEDEKDIGKCEYCPSGRVIHSNEVYCDLNVGNCDKCHKENIIPEDDMEK